MGKKIKKARIAGTLAFVSAFSADQVTKILVVANSIPLSSGIPVFYGFNIVYLRNEGVAFGLFDYAPWWVILCTTIFISLWITALLIRSVLKHESIAFGLILGGAVGNIVDRVRFQGVTDFLDFYVGSFHWPTFNLADVAIFIGAGVLIFFPKPSRPSNRELDG